MKPKSLLVGITAAAATFLGLASTPSQASLITHNFTGATSSYSETGPAAVALPDVATGTAVTGSFTYDTDAPLYSAISGTNYFTLTEFSIQIAGAPHFAFVATTDSTIVVSETSGFAQIYGTSDADSTYPYATAYLNSNNGAPFISTTAEIASLIPALNLGSYALVFSSESRAGGLFNVTSVLLAPAVPEPTTALFGAALLGTLGVTRRRQRQVSAPVA